ncbi:Fe(3+)-hydroxamate ABC transporter permease FhuB [Salinisphaera sp. Q1T1-3]|uniref:Fe(3+)-hydroxamate ABC transporter permease FhuB n=1 Tax=Salinisphaera sp. Q1T1-3 TaxID=2321229 RepID=UPI000E733392|nr:Fe(3+)-hydroxamate ABC transporter permease FhuB [Salinisphaera sp. Q1T1-3]RJS93617.1 Fe(3+)-hydroxamate ABC transporter permease FhuB [Salinisphaera sp. Q1T1-3]
MNRRPRITPARLCGFLGLPVVVLAVAALRATTEGNLQAIWAGPGADDITSVLVYFSWLPRLVVALIAGAGLALAGVLMQQTLRNPLASPTTLGVATGAQALLLVATLFAPGLLIYGRGLIAFIGGALAVALVFALAWRRGLAPTVLVLAGLVVNLYLGAVSLALILFNQESLHGLMIWGAGSLAQQNWSDVVHLAPCLVIVALGAGILSRSLALLDLDEVNARNLGVSMLWLRTVSLGLAVFVTASIVSRLGLIGFIGLASPAIVRLAGARTLKARLIWSPLFGALLLTLTDLALQLIAGRNAALIPTGATTAALGAPLLLWLVPRLSMNARSPNTNAPPPIPRRNAPWRLIGFAVVATLVMIIIALFAGRDAHGWNAPFALPWAETGHWRAPRVLAAGMAGMLLALAGTLIQRVSGNPMASPEVLGVSAGTGMGLLALIWFVPGAGTLALLGAGTGGALTTLVVLIAINARSGFEPEQLLLTGIAVMFAFDAIQRIVLAGNDPRTQSMLAWVSGSTYFVDMHTAIVISSVGLVLVALAWPLGRWLDVLPLGELVSRALGLHVTVSRVVLLGLVAVLTAAATLIVGPLSFVGLLAPHLARLSGLARARPHMAGAMVFGALLMIAADWVGRQVIFPNEIPAGLVATLIGGSYFMWRLRRL